MSATHWRTGLVEMYRSLSKRAFVGELKRLVPEIDSSDLVPATAGVRAQAVQADGSLIDDFRFESCDNIINVLNVPSPAATASIVIGRTIVSMISTNFGLD
jgi:(S)-2-hydroxyglutarate dehydrogenase